MLINEKKIKIYLISFLTIFTFLLAFITAFQSTQIVIKKIELSTMEAEEQLKESVGEISFESTANIVYKEMIYNVKFNVRNLNTAYTYNIVFYINNKKVENIEYKNVDKITDTINIEKYFKTEGNNNLYIVILENNSTLKYQRTQEIYYVIPYTEQFLDRLEYHTICFAPRYMGNLVNEINMLKSLGINQVRSDIFLTSVYENPIPNFTNVSNWIGKLIKNNIDIELVLNTDKNKTLFGTDGKISSDTELNKFITYTKEIIEKYPNINKFEILNEPNFYYTSKEDIYWYSELIKNLYNIIKEKNSNNKIIAGSTAIIANDNRDSIKFLNEISQRGVYENSDSFSTHFYDFNASGDNNTFKMLLKEHSDFINQIGGFQDINITEYGISTGGAGRAEQEKAEKLIQQTNILKKWNIENNAIYSYIDNKEESSDREDNFGILNYNYTPKPAYYAMKNYYENTNGAEYIGTINLAEGLEAHVYNKDGKPKIITWAKDNTKNITLEYKDFTATDLYGKEIQNQNGTITITSSPVYLDNIQTSYYYQAISNTSLEKYAKFEEKFKTELEKVPTIQSNIDVQKNYMQNLVNQTQISQETAIQEMQNHYNIGTELIKAVKENKLNIEYVKLSSMLDTLEDIGKSYEDLVTVTAIERNVDIQKAKKQIEETEKLIKNNEKLEIIYPEKIIQLSKDYNEKAEYINSLEEENPIKTGLIVSKNIHSELLESWAKDFAKIYIDKYLEEHKPTITYSTTEFTNKDVIATINTDIDIQVTNNNGNKTYTFTQNGTFTFKYTINGTEYEITATANNIDKTMPVISGVENGQTYYIDQNIAPKATDANLKEVKLYLNNVDVNYKNGQIINVEGIYKMIATDKAGNTISVQFQVMKRPESKYELDGKTIKKIKYNTSKEQFDKNIGILKDYKITRKNGKTELKQTDIIASGDILTTSSGVKYTLIVAGDITKDGQVTVDDFTRMRQYLLGLRKLDEVEKLSADANCDEKELSIDDYIRIRILILEQLSWK